MTNPELVVPSPCLHSGLVKLLQLHKINSVSLIFKHNNYCKLREWLKQWVTLLDPAVTKKSVSDKNKVQECFCPLWHLTSWKSINMKIHWILVHVILTQKHSQKCRLYLILDQRFLHSFLHHSKQIQPHLCNHAPKNLVNVLLYVQLQQLYFHSTLQRVDSKWPLPCHEILSMVSSCFSSSINKLDSYSPQYDHF